MTGLIIVVMAGAARTDPGQWKDGDYKHLFVSHESYDEIFYNILFNALHLVDIVDYAIGFRPFRVWEGFAMIPSDFIRYLLHGTIFEKIFAT